MITPRFEVTQDDEFITICMKIKYVKTSDCEFYINENIFTFHCNPYFLKLTLPKPITENGTESAVFDVEKGELRVRVPKRNYGEYFENLDMISSLLYKGKPSQQNKPSIEIIGENTSNNNDDINEDEEEIDWSFPQVIETEEELNLGSIKYGFNNAYDGYFSNSQMNISEIIDNPFPDSITPEEIRKLRLVLEQDQFDADHFIADFLDNEMIISTIKYEAEWEKEFKFKRQLRHENQQNGSIDNKLTLQKIDEQAIKFTDEDIDSMIRLPKREYIIENERHTMLSLVDIMFAYAYYVRTNFGEDNVEADWTIAKLSSTLSWFERFNTIKECLVACVRRSLIYPIYRYYKLSMKVIDDVKKIFYLGKRAIIRYLCRIKKIFDLSETKHYLSRLYIEDYCIWIQRVSSKKIHSVYKSISELKITKEDTEFPLQALEDLAIEAQQEYE